MKPAEYWAMSADDWHMANAVQAAWREGQQSATNDEQQQKAREERQSAWIDAAEALDGMTG